MAEYAVETIGLGRRFGRIEALTDVSLTVPTGGLHIAMSVLGASGFALIPVMTRPRPLHMQGAEAASYRAAYREHGEQMALNRQRRGNMAGVGECLPAEPTVETAVGREGGCAVTRRAGAVFAAALILTCALASILPDAVRVAYFHRHGATKPAAREEFERLLYRYGDFRDEMWTSSSEC